MQWSKTRYPWVKAGEKFTFATSALLTLDPGVWYYRVRGVNFSLPGTARAMSWSTPVGLKVAKPTFAVVKKSGRQLRPRSGLWGLARAVSAPADAALAPE